MTEQAKTISRDKLKEKVEKGQDVQIVNVLPEEAAAQGLIKGSRNIPLADLDKRAGELDKSKEVVVYCKNKDCQASPKAAEELAKKGFTVFDYEEGIDDWKQAGLPLA